MKAFTSMLAIALFPAANGFAFSSIGRSRVGNDASSLQPIFASTMEGDVDVTSSSTSTDSKQQQNQPSFDSFDYTSHWYPVTWARDVPLNEPIRVTLFDVDYVLAKTSSNDTNDKKKTKKGPEDEVFFAMIDSCPHKKVALSEGRITDCGSNDKRYLQCSYHGWTFDGENGKCMEIPQTVIAQEYTNKQREQQSDPKDNTSTAAQQTQVVTKKRREDATSIAVQIVQGMVWLQPSYTPLEALAAMEQGTLQSPPRVPEMDLEGYKSTSAVRDFPIDWTVLLENILDPDHGYFAHSGSGTAGKGFDLYASDGVENVQQIDEDFTNGGWKIQGSVNAVPKLLEFNQNVRSATAGGEGDEKPNSKKTKKAKEEPPKLLATSTFDAPALAYQCRKTNLTASSAFVSAFWVCPTGVGKSRFMSATIGKFALPRWLLHMNLNNFLDQDTYLLCGQHRAVLQKEAEGYLEMDSSGADAGRPNNVRKSTYVYRSPSERLPVRIGQYFDATLARAPNRKAGVLAWYDKNAKDGRLFESWPSREEVLDRYEQHTKICPDSLAVVKRCDKTMKRSKLLGLALVFMKMLSQGSTGLGQQTVLGNPLVTVANRIATSLLRGKAFYAIISLAFLSYNVASRIKREFFFKFDNELHHKDIKAIAKNWVDL